MQARRPSVAERYTHHTLPLQLIPIPVSLVAGNGRKTTPHHGQILTYFNLGIVELRFIPVKQENMTFISGIELYSSPPGNPEQVHTS